MAERRMFSKSIVFSDEFLDMPMSSRNLYFSLCMVADDDGFVNQPKTIIRMVGASSDDMSVLTAKKFIIPFDCGVIVIRHWKIHNYIQSDRKHETQYKDLLASITTDKNKVYQIVGKLDTSRIQDVSRMDSEVSIGKSSVDKVSIDKIISAESHQTIRAKRSKYPAPVDNLQTSEIICKQMQADECICSRNPIQSESESNPIRLHSADKPRRNVRLFY